MAPKTILASAITAVIVVAVLLMINSPGPQPAAAAGEQPELLIYCGITMIKPMNDIARIVEKETGCRILLTKGGSGNLLHSIRVNQVGDLYLPGSDSYIKTCIADKIIAPADTALVGYNKAAIMVQKGNPMGISGQLSDLCDSRYRVVIGNPDSGSIGRETRKILEKAGLFEKVKFNALQLTTDSKKLISVLRDNEADVVINWYAAGTWDGHAECVDIIPIDEKLAQKKKLVLGVLKYSKHPAIARHFIKVAASEQGQQIFRKYGLLDVK